MISTMSSENVLLQCSGARPGRWDSLQSSLEACPHPDEDSRSPETQGRSGEKGHGTCVVTRRLGRGFRRWGFVSVLGERFPFSIPCPIQKVHAIHPPSQLRDKGRAEKGTWDLELLLFSEQWECLVPGRLVKTLHIWGPFMGCDMKSLSKLKPCTSSADEDAIASHSFHILSGSIILAL